MDWEQTGVADDDSQSGEDPDDSDYEEPPPEDLADIVQEDNKDELWDEADDGSDDDAADDDADDDADAGDADAGDAPKRRKQPPRRASKKKKADDGAADDDDEGAPKKTPPRARFTPPSMPREVKAKGNAERREALLRDSEKLAHALRRVVVDRGAATEAPADGAGTLTIRMPDDVWPRVLGSRAPDGEKPRFEIPRPDVDGAPTGSAKGKTFVMTGVFPEVGGGAGLNLGKDRVKAMIESFGGRVTGSVSGRTDVLVVGKKPGDVKMTAARRSPKCALTDSHCLRLALQHGSVHTLVHRGLSPSRPLAFDVGAVASAAVRAEDPAAAVLRALRRPLDDALLKCTTTTFRRAAVRRTLLLLRTQKTEAEAAAGCDAHVALALELLETRQATDGVSMPRGDGSKRWAVAANYAPQGVGPYASKKAMVEHCYGKLSPALAAKFAKVGLKKMFDGWGRARNGGDRKPLMTTCAVVGMVCVAAGAAGERDGATRYSKLIEGAERELVSRATLFDVTFAYKMGDARQGTRPDGSLRTPEPSRADEKASGALCSAAIQWHLLETGAVSLLVTTGKNAGDQICGPFFEKGAADDVTTSVESALGVIRVLAGERTVRRCPLGRILGVAAILYVGEGVHMKAVIVFQLPHPSVLEDAPYYAALLLNHVLLGGSEKSALISCDESSYSSAFKTGYSLADGFQPGNPGPVALANDNAARERARDSLFQAEHGGAVARAKDDAARERARAVQYQTGAATVTSTKQCRLLATTPAMAALRRRLDSGANLTFTEPEDGARFRLFAVEHMPNVAAYYRETPGCENLLAAYLACSDPHKSFDYRAWAWLRCADGERMPMNVVEAMEKLDIEDMDVAALKARLARFDITEFPRSKKDLKALVYEAMGW